MPPPSPRVDLIFFGACLADFHWLRPTANDCKLSFRQHVCKNHAPGQQTQPQMGLSCPPLFPWHARCCRRQLQDFLYSYLKNGNCVLCVCCSGRRLHRLASGPYSSSCSSLRSGCFLFVLLLVFIVFLLSVLFTLLQSTVGIGSCFSCAYLYIYVHTHIHTHSYIYKCIFIYRERMLARNTTAGRLSAFVFVFVF